MVWNWEQPDWPRFRWESSLLEASERRFLYGGGRLFGCVEHLDREAFDGLVVEAFTSEALRTSEIEGEVLERASVQSSIRRRLGLAGAAPLGRPAEEGVAAVMVDLYRNATEPLSEAVLFNWHAMLMSGRAYLRDVGRYRTHPEPMQVVSSSLHEPTVHFEAPPSSRVSEEMDGFLAWFNASAATGGAPVSGVARAGLAHLYFVSIHPFEDGNGRIARAISEKALAQALGRPSLTALAATILIRRKAYYNRLERANKGNEVTSWLMWFAGVAIEAQMRTQSHIEFTLDKAKLLDRVSSQVNDRQEKALLRMFREGPEGFKGGLSAGNYVSITKSSTATATRDLAELVEMGALSKTGERRHTRYHLAIPLRPVPCVTLAEDGSILEDGEAPDQLS